MYSLRPRPHWIGTQVNIYTGKKGVIVIGPDTSEEDLQLIAELYPNAVEKKRKLKKSEDNGEISD